jgi:O-antigen ligase
VILLFLPFLFRLNDPHSRLLQIFLLVIGLQLLISEDIGTGIQDIITIVTIFGLIVYFAHALQEDEAYYWLSVVIGVLGAVGCFVLYLQIESLPYINPNSLAAFPLTAVLTITLVYSKTERTPHRKLVLLILAAVNFIWVIYPGSRGNIFIGICSMFVLLLMTRSVSRILLILIVVLLLGFWLSSMFIEQTNFLLERLRYTFDPSYTFAQRTSGRSNIAQAGLNMFSDFPLGAGTGNFRSYISTYEVVDYRARDAESGWIKTLAENGIPGLLILVAYVGSFTIVGWRKRNQGMLLIGVLVTISLGVGFITKVFEGKSMFFLAAGGTVFLHRDEMIKYIHRRTNLIKERNKFIRKYDRLNRIQNDRR